VEGPEKFASLVGEISRVPIEQMGTITDLGKAEVESIPIPWTQK
jgi:hypothetical protein